MGTRSTTRRAVAALIAATTGLAALSASAQTPPAPPPAAPPPAPPAPAEAPDPKIEEAREAFRVGNALAKQAQWTDALAAFERSARLRPHAVTTYNIGFCERALGRFTRAKRSLSRALAAPPNELPADLAAQARAYLAEIDQRLTRAVITLSRPGVAVSVDGRPLEAAGGSPAHPELVAGTREPGPAEPVASGGFDLLLDPGTHVLVVSVPGAPDAVVTRDFAAGTTAALTLAANPIPVKAPPPKPATSSRRTGAAVAFALGGAFAIAGGVFGGLALKDKSDLDGLCKQKDRCPSSAQGTIDAMGTFATVSTVGVGAAVAGVGVGVVLLATSGDGKPQGVTARPWIGPGMAGIRGTF